MRDDEQRVVVTKPLAGAGEAAPRALQHHRQRLTAGARHQHRLRRLAPRGQPLAVLGTDLTGELAFPGAVGDFHQLRIEAQHRSARVTERHFRRAPRARQRRGDGAGDANAGEALGQQRRLTLPTGESGMSIWPW